MDRATRLVILLALASVLAGCAAPEESRPEPPGEEAPPALTIVPADDLTWRDGPPSLPVGARVAPLSEGEAAGRTFRVELPAGYEVPPHTHPDTEELTILSGTAYLALGEQPDRSEATELPPGSYLLIPAGTEHLFFTAGEPLVMQVHAHGPFDIHYVDAADDPRQT